MKIGLGAMLVVGGLAFTAISYASAQGGGRFTLLWGAVLYGGYMFVTGLLQREPDDAAERSADLYAAPAPLPAAMPDGTPSGSPARLIAGGITENDYPANAMRKGIEGVVEIAFTVDTQGAVRDAGIAKSSGDASLDEAARRIISTRFRYTPARDEHGEPVAEARRQSIRWQLD